MILIFRSFLAGSLLALSACGGGDPVANRAEAAASLPAPQSINASDPSGAPPPANALSRQLPDQRASSGPVAAIPAALQGRWGLNPEDCFPERGDNRGVLEVGESQVRFFESVARPRANSAASKDSYNADFVFSGEGQTWTKYQSLELQDGRLVRTESSPMASYTYAKCS